VTHVLLIDDDPLIRMLMGGVLEQLGCTSFPCDDSSCAAKQIAGAASAGAPFDLVLLDLQLGGETGFDVCRSLRASGVRVPIVCVSGDAAAHDPARFRDAGFDGVLSKPVSIEALGGCLAEYVAGWEAPDASDAASNGSVTKQ
jgi:CheY-like chemotaxis protein